MAAQQRPLSPHLQVYTQPLTAGAMSIFHRITGGVLAIGAFLVPVWLLAVAGGSEAYARFAACAASWPGIIAIALGTVALVYHLLNGLRHLLWDIGWGFDIPDVYRSGWTVAVLTVVFTAVIWWVALASGGAA